MTQQEKQQAIDALRRRTKAQRTQLETIEPRLAEYYDHLCEHSGTELGDPNDLHNGWELLCALRLLRLLRTYTIDSGKVKDAVFDFEGEWKRGSDGFWHHVCGGLKQPGREQPEVYRLEPFQVFCLTAMYGLRAWIPTGNYKGDRPLAATECIEPETNEIMDLRRLCTRFILFGPRKINKSGYGAFCNVLDFMKGDYDAQVVCTANSQEQSKILFNKTKDFLLQLDPVTGRKFTGKYLSYSATEIKFQKGAWRQATLQAIPAGGKMPDGKFASQSAEDEYGSAGYTNGCSDMGQTAATIESSMGPRREPMILITTSASLISNGPFIEMLDATHIELLKELKYDTGEADPQLKYDRRMCLLLEPDRWERDDEYLLSNTTIRRKVNPMLGKIVQHSFYEDAVAEARMDDVHLKETISKLFNIFQSTKTKEWIKPDEIRELQTDRRIDQCHGDDGWMVWAGLDFSKGDDLNGTSYLAFNIRTGEFFADMDSYMSEKAVNESPLRELYLKWAADGWLHIVPGKTFSPEWPVNRIIELDGKGVNFFGFGYDPYNAKIVVNALSQWVFDAGVDPKQIIIPVRQNFATYNPAVADIEYFIRRSVEGRDGKQYPQPLIHFSRNPMWPWQFGNSMLLESTGDGMGNVKPVKSSASGKVDNVQMLLSALILYMQQESQIIK